MKFTPFNAAFDFNVVRGGRCEVGSVSIQHMGMLIGVAVGVSISHL